MRFRPMLLLLLPALLSGAPEWLLIRTSDGVQGEGQADLPRIPVEIAGHRRKLRAAELLSIHSGLPASASEREQIDAGLTAIQGKDRQARDRAVEELTGIGVPVMTPLLAAIRDTDQHEPNPLYRLFGRIMPSIADGPDRSQSLVRLSNGGAVRCALPSGSIALRKADGGKQSLEWAAIRTHRDSEEERAARHAGPLAPPLHADRVPGYRCDRYCQLIFGD